MPYLTRRAEQALLGALIANATNPSVTEEGYRILASEDFGHRAHRQVFEALKDFRAQRSELSGGDLLAAIADRLTAPGADVEWLTQMRSAAAPAHGIASYTQMVQLAALRRDIAAHATTIARAMPDPLGEALRRNARIHKNLTGETPTTAQPTPLVQSQGSSLKASNSARGDWRVRGLVRGAGIRQSEKRFRYEDLLLADLIQNPEQVNEVDRITDRGTFTSEQRADIYDTIVALDRSGAPIDAVMIGWKLEQQRMSLVARFSENGRNVNPRSEPDLDYANRLSFTDSPFSAVEIARFLVTEDITADLAKRHPDLKSDRIHRPSPDAPVVDRPTVPDPNRLPPPEPPTPNPRIKP